MSFFVGLFFLLVIGGHHLAAILFNRQVGIGINWCQHMKDVADFFKLVVVVFCQWSHFDKTRDNRHLGFGRKIVGTAFYGSGLLIVEPHFLFWINQNVMALCQMFFQ